jgi:hypothetical protein
MLRLRVSRPDRLGVKSPSVVQEQICYCQTVGSFLRWETLSEEWMGLSFTVTASSYQRSYSWISVPRDSRPYFTVSDSRLRSSQLYPPESESESEYITTDSQSVSMSWCRAQSGTFDQRYFFLKVTVLSFGGVLSDERSGL